MLGEKDRRNIVLKVAWGFLGLPYRWGGDDPMEGFDCSGLVIECFKSVGMIGRGKDFTAHGIFTAWRDGLIGLGVPSPGDLVFWQNDQGRIVHVEIAVNSELAIGASGGGSGTRTEADAAVQNAYIKVRPIASRSRYAGAINPYGLQML